MSRPEASSPRSTHRSMSTSPPTSTNADSKPTTFAPPRAARGQAGRVAKLRRVLDDRHLAVLGSLYRLRLLTTNHIQRLHVEDGTFAGRRRRAQALLRRLSDLRLVVPLGRQVGGVRAGSSGTVFGLSGLGLAVLDLPGPYGQRRRTVWQTKPYFQEHMLAVSDVYVDLVEHCRQAGVDLLDFDAEPQAWRRFHGAGGETVVLKPDGYARVGVGEFELSSFIEVDLGTESLPTIRRKCQVFASYWQSGLEQQQTGTFPRVCWLVPTERRLHGIAELLSRWHEHTRDLFSVALMHDGPALLTTAPAGGSA